MSKDLVKIIKENPGCKAIVDNDCWWIQNKDGTELVCSDDKIVRIGDGGYGSGNCYGGDILQALAKIVGMKVESV